MPHLIVNVDNNKKIADKDNYSEKEYNNYNDKTEDGN